jgi:hypothetical protein
MPGPHVKSALKTKKSHNTRTIRWIVIFSMWSYLLSMFLITDCPSNLFLGIHCTFYPRLWTRPLTFYFCIVLSLMHLLTVLYSLSCFTLRYILLAYIYHLYVVHNSLLRIAFYSHTHIPYTLYTISYFTLRYSHIHLFPISLRQFTVSHCNILTYIY